MTDRPDQSPSCHESPLYPADDERIRRLLAEARHTEPMPEAVAARLDQVLADLVADRAEREPPEPAAAPVDLAARPARTAANLLVAAAAVVPVGFGITQVLPDAASAAAAATRRPPTTAAGGEAAAERPTAPETAVVAADPAARGRRGPQSQAFAIRSERFGPDVRRVRDELLRNERPPPDPARAARHRRQVRRGRPRDLRRSPRRSGPAAARGRRPGRRPLPLRRRRTALFDHLDLTLRGRPLSLGLV